MSYSVVIVFSNWTILKICNFFTDYLDAENEIGMYKIIRYKDNNGNYRDSNRTLFLIKNTLFNRAIESGLDMEQPNLDFRIEVFNLTQNHYPKEGYISNFYIKIPKDLTEINCELLIKEKLDIFIKYGLISLKNYSLKIPLESRMSGEHRGFAILKFENVELNIIAYIKLLMHDSFLYIKDKTIYNLPVYWSKGSKVPVYKILKI